jgi:hypothetical protein
VPGDWIPTAGSYTLRFRTTNNTDSEPVLFKFVAKKGNQTLYVAAGIAVVSPFDWIPSQGYRGYLRVDYCSRRLRLRQVLALALAVMGYMLVKHKHSAKAFLVSFLNYEGMLVAEVRSRSVCVPLRSVRLASTDCAEL